MKFNPERLVWHRRPSRRAAAVPAGRRRQRPQSIGEIALEGEPAGPVQESRSVDTRQSIEEIDPDVFGSSVDKAAVERLARSIVVRPIDPAPPDFKALDDAADHPAVVMRRQMRLDPRKLSALIQKRSRFIRASSRKP